MRAFAEKRFQQLMVEPLRTAYDRVQPFCSHLMYADDGKLLDALDAARCEHREVHHRQFANVLEAVLLHAQAKSTTLSDALCRMASSTLRTDVRQLLQQLTDNRALCVFDSDVDDGVLQLANTAREQLYEQYRRYNRPPTVKFLVSTEAQQAITVHAMVPAGNNSYLLHRLDTLTRTDCVAQVLHFIATLHAVSLYSEWDKTFVSRIKQKCDCILQHLTTHIHTGMALAMFRNAGRRHS